MEGEDQDKIESAIEAMRQVYMAQSTVRYPLPPLFEEGDPLAQAQNQLQPLWSSCTGWARVDRAGPHGYPTLAFPPHEPTRYTPLMFVRYSVWVRGYRAVTRPILTLLKRKPYEPPCLVGGIERISWET